MTKAYRHIGFLVSGVLHLGAAAAFTPLLVQHKADTSDEIVPITLAMFRESPPKIIPRAVVSPTPPVKETPLTAPPKKRPPVSPPKQATKAKPRQDKRTNNSQRSQHHPKPRLEKTNQVADNKLRTKRSDKVSDTGTHRIAANATSKATVSPLNHTAVTAEIDNIKTRYLRELHERIRRNQFYPRKARRRRIKGNVSIAFVIDRSGQFSNIRVQQSSGSDLLDDAAQKTLKNIQSFHPIPEVLGMENWELVVPIRYRLRR